MINIGMHACMTYDRWSSSSFPWPRVRGKPSRIQCYNARIFLSNQGTDTPDQGALTLLWRASSLLVTTLSMISSGSRPPDATISSASKPTSVLRNVYAIQHSIQAQAHTAYDVNALFCYVLPKEVPSRKRYDLILFGEPGRKRALARTRLA